MMNMFELAVVTPPVATNFYVAKSLIPEATLGDVTRGIIPFFVMELLTICILIVFPQISLWLPNATLGASFALPNLSRSNYIHAAGG